MKPEKLSLIHLLTSTGGREALPNSCRTPQGQVNDGIGSFADASRDLRGLSRPSESQGQKKAQSALLGLSYPDGCKKRAADSCGCSSSCGHLGSCLNAGQGEHRPAR